MEVGTRQPGASSEGAANTRAKEQKRSTAAADPRAAVLDLALPAAPAALRDGQAVSREPGEGQSGQLIADR